MHGHVHAYVPTSAFLKQFPAHGPILLPPGAISERDYMRPPQKYAFDLWRNRTKAQPQATAAQPQATAKAAATAAAVAATEAAAATAEAAAAVTKDVVTVTREAAAAAAAVSGLLPVLLPSSACAHRCHGIGWCDGQHAHAHARAHVHARAHAHMHMHTCTGAMANSTCIQELAGCADARCTWRANRGVRRL